MNGPPPPWTVFFSVLRLSAKYNFYGLQRGMLHHLETAYPSTYEHYLARRDPNRLGLRYWGIEPSPAILFQLINFIRGCHAVHCLPFAFYEACQLFVGDSITYQLEGACPLSSTDFKAVILGATALQNDEIDLMRTIFTNKQANCECALTCSEEKSRLAVAGVCFAMWCGMPSTVKTSTSPLLDTPLSSFTPQADAAFCPPCWAAWDGTWKRGKRAMWDRLPEYFGLPPWDMLLREGKGEDADSRMSS